MSFLSFRLLTLNNYCPFPPSFDMGTKSSTRRVRILTYTCQLHDFHQIRQFKCHFLSYYCSKVAVEFEQNGTNTSKSTFLLNLEFFWKKSDFSKLGNSEKLLYTMV